MGKQILLDEHVGRVDADVFAARSDECECLVFLSDRERYVILSHLLPYAEWRTRFVIPVSRERYELTDESTFSSYTLWLSGLVAKLTGGDGMACNQALAAALSEIAAALRQPGGAWGGGGSNCYPGQGQVLSCLNGYTDDQLLDRPAEGVDPQGEVPPAGFDDMAEYRDYKCKVANAIVDDTVKFFRTLQGIGGFEATLAVITPVLFAALMGTGAIAFPPADIVAMAIVCISVLAISAIGFSVCGTMADHVEADRENIVCSLYTSSNTVAAAAAIGNAVEDAVQAVEWTSLFGAELGAQLAGLFGQIASKFESNGVVNSLFRLATDFVYPAVDCSGCEGSTSYEWHFTENAEGWQHTDLSSPPSHQDGSWSSASPTDPNDQDAGHLHSEMTVVGQNGSAGAWRFYFPWRPTAGEDTVLAAHVYIDQSGGGHRARVGIHFLDETAVQADNDGTGWVAFSVTLVNHAESWGKLIDHISVDDWDFSGTGENDLEVDHVILTIE